MDDAIDLAKKGDLKFFQDAPLDVLLNARDSNTDDTVLSIVVNDNRLDCCEVICERCPSLSYQQTRQDRSTPLHIAAYNGYLDILKVLISTCDKADQEEDRAGKQKTLTVTDNEGQNFFHYAVKFKRMEMVNYILGIKEITPAVLNSQDNFGKTPWDLAAASQNKDILFKAAQENHLFLCKELYKRCPSLIYHQSKGRRTALHYAAWSGEPEMLKFLIKADAKSDNIKSGGGEKVPQKLLKMVDDSGHTALHKAVQNNKLEAVKLLVNADPSLMYDQCNDKSTALHHAAWKGEPEMLKFLIEITKSDEEDDIKSGGGEKVPQKLLKMVNDRGHTALHRSVLKYKLEAVKLLVEADPSLIYVQSNNGSTALHHAAWKGEPEIVKFLIEADAKSDEEDEIESGGREKTPQNLLTMVDVKGHTALHKAVLYHKVDALKLLVEADPNKELLRAGDLSKNTALHLAVGEKANYGMARLLIEADRDFHYGANLDEKTPLLIAIDKAAGWENDRVMLKLIMELQPTQSMVSVNEDGMTALHYCVSRKYLDTTEYIIQSCPESSSVADNEGKNFLHVAAKLDIIEVVRMVLRAKDIPSNVLHHQDKDGNTPFDIAEKAENKNLTKCFLSDLRFIKTVTPGEKNGSTVLHQATSEGDLSIINKFIKFWPSYLGVEQLDKEGKNFLHIAAEFEKVEIVKQVLRAKDIPDDVLNHQDDDGNTPFHIAALTGNEPLTRCFLFHPNIKKDTTNKKHQHVLSAIKFPYDKRKAKVVQIAHTVDQSDLKDQSDFDLVVGALIATVSFTAGIMVPGGYISEGPNQGTAVFSKKVSFAIFIISNSFALIFSFYAVFSHFYARRLTEDEHIICLLDVAKGCTLAAMYCMLVAFIAGSFAVLANSNWLAIAVCIISCPFFILSFGPLWMIRMESKCTAPANQTNTNVLNEQTTACLVGLLPISNTPMSERLCVQFPSTVFGRISYWVKVFKLCWSRPSGP